MTIWISSFKMLLGSKKLELQKKCFDFLYYGYEIDVSNVLYTYIYMLRYSILTPICLYIHYILMYMYM